MSGPLRRVLGVVLAGIVGTLVNTAAAAALLGADKLGFALVPGRYGVAIGVAALIPMALTVSGGLMGWALAGALLVVIPSVLAKLVFGAGAPWLLVLGLNAVYAGAALASYRMVAGQA